MKYFYGFCIAVVVLFVVFVVFGYLTQCENISIYHPIWKGCEINFAGGSR